MFYAWVTFHVLTCIALIVVVLMQSAKGEGLAGGTAFGGGVSGAVFGGRGAASFLSRATTVLASVFIINCLALALMSSNAANVADPTTATTSAVTEQAQQAQDQALEQQQRLLEQRQADSLRAADTTQQLQLLPVGDPVDTSGN